ncbi:uncharacterized protein LOC135398260 [Ornithodoros turicata]|uniref:uncharacterized protein LOC135398260 n=1 Tax=Ornithodoros turicata TaxID=34597 RepID=UPI00313894E0
MYGLFYPYGMMLPRLPLGLRGRPRTHYFLPKLRTLQELCERVLVSKLSLRQYKLMTLMFAEPFRRSISTLLSEYFTGCAVDFCLEWTFTKHGKPSYSVRCTLDGQKYLAIKAVATPTSIKDDDLFWKWTKLQHDNLLSIFVVAVDIPAAKVFLVTALPEDNLDRFASQLSAKLLCIQEFFLWKFLAQLCSVIQYIESAGLVCSSFDCTNIHLGHANVILNNMLTWRNKKLDLCNMPEVVRNVVFGSESCCQQFLDTLSGARNTTVSLGLVMCQLIHLALRKQIIEEEKRVQELHCFYSVDLALSPSTYSEELLNTVAELYQLPQPSLQAVEKKAAEVMAEISRHAGSDPTTAT